MADQYDQKSYPSIVSRTLDPSKKALATVVCLHDHEITDADLNLMQDLQDLKRSEQLQDKSCVSGSLTYAPLQFNTGLANAFFVPAFDVLWNNVEIITIAGNDSPNLGLNRVTLPVPNYWAPGTLAEDAAVYVVFLEIWYQSLNPITGAGYNQNPATPGLNYFFPYGGINPDPSNAFSVPDDSIDPFQGDFTTQRAQVQWSINVQPVSTTYNFQTYQFGIDPDTTDIPPFGVPLNSVYAQAGLNAPVQSQQYQFVNMGTINGDTGLWRSGSPPWSSTVTYNLGDVVTLGGVTYSSQQVGNLNNNPAAGSPWQVTSVGNVNNSLGTMDGYSYAMPIALVFQRNYGNFDIVANPFGCADPAFPSVVNGGTNGLLSSGISGRYDSRVADQVFPDNVIDTRATNTLDAWDKEQLLGLGFGDLVQGKTTLAVARGLSPGNKIEDLGSTLPFYVSMAPAQVGSVFPAGTWDGFANGFSSDQRTYESTVQITTDDKSSLGPGSTQGGNWLEGDTFTVTLPSTSVATITDVTVTALVSNAALGTKTPAALLQGQVTISGLGTTSATVTLATDLVGTLFDPGPNNIYATLSVTYPAGSGVDLQQIPFTIDGGSLFDSQAGETLPVFGISEYDVQSLQTILPTSTLVNSQPTTVTEVIAVNPEYSDIVLGTKIWLAVPGLAGVQQAVGGSTVTVFIIPMADINGALGGLYVTQAWDQASGNFYNVSSVIMSGNTAASQNCVVTLQGAVPGSSTVIFSILASTTCQIAYNAPVKGVTQIEETVMFGNYTGNNVFPTDPRITIENISQSGGAGTATTIVLGANGCSVKGISGNNVVPYIWVLTGPNTLTATPITSLNFVNDVIVVTVPGSVTLTGVGAQPFLFVGSVLPALSPQSTLIVELRYIPYQGEGVIGRDYEFLIAEDNALVTSNGTGAAPVIGLTDVYPYNRELPIITMLPAQTNWNDAGLTNTALASLFDSNYVAMRQNNVETVFLVPLHTNDFIPPVNRDTRKTIRFLTAGQRGFASATPHIGFGITAPTPRTVLGQNLQNTIAPITLYVDNVNGNDANTGLSANEAKATFASALGEMPPVLSFPCVIIMNNAAPYVINNISASLETVALGDGDIRSAKVYCLGNLSRVIQGEGRLVISAPTGATSPVIINATGFAGFGDGPTVGFYIDTSRVILNGIQFVGFQNPAVMAYNADIDMVGCSWVGNAQAGSYTGCDSVILDGGSTSLPDSASGHVCVQSNLTSSNHNLVAAGPSAPPQPGVFYTGSRNSTLNLQTHFAGAASQTDENWQSPTANIVVAEAQINSSIVVTTDFQTNGAAVLQANSVLSQTAVQSPFLGGVSADASSSVVTQV